MKTLRSAEHMAVAPEFGTKSKNWIDGGVAPGLRAVYGVPHTRCLLLKGAVHKGVTLSCESLPSPSGVTP